MWHGEGFLLLHCSTLLSMPAYSQKSDALSVKLIGLYPGNEAKGLPSHQGLVVVFDASTGSVLAVRVACNTYVAVELLLLLLLSLLLM